MITIPIDITSVIIGLIIGMPLGAFLMHRHLIKKMDEGGVNEKTATINLVAWVYTAVWAFWHLQAAQGGLLPVPTIFDAMGGIAAGISLGLDASVALGMIGRMFGGRDKKEDK